MPTTKTRKKPAPSAPLKLSPEAARALVFVSQARRELEVAEHNMREAQADFDRAVGRYVQPVKVSRITGSQIQAS